MTHCNQYAHLLLLSIIAIVGLALEALGFSHKKRVYPAMMYQERDASSGDVYSTHWNVQCLLFIKAAHLAGSLRVD